jgi:acetyltransferase
VTATGTGTAGTAATERFRALFEPRGVLVAGASTHPGKFGFVSLHNILATGYRGKVFATNRDGAEVLGVRTVPAVADLPEGEIDLVFVCTPASANADLLRDCAKKGITAAFLASAGYGEAGDEGRRAQDELVALADELGILLAGPNGQGVVSPPVGLCAQIVGPYPPRGHIAIASQSGNFVSSFMNYAQLTGVGVSRAVSAGNAAAVTVPDYLAYFADDPETRVSLAYVESVGDGRGFFDRLRVLAERKPIVLVKGGVTAGGQRAAASHTGALASDDRVFDGVCRQAGISRADTVEQAYEVAATFASQPLPAGNRVGVVTTAGGWGVVTADAIAGTGLTLAALPDDLRTAIDAELPPRWSRNNPVDMAGGETRDTVPRVLDLVAGHPDVDAVIFLGLGIQSNEAQLMRDGRFYPDHGLERIVAYHERQDARFAEAAAEVADRTGKPVLVASELAVTSPDNPGPAGVRASGRVCYPSANRAVTALDHLWRRSRWLRRRGLA